MIPISPCRWFMMLLGLGCWVQAQDVPSAQQHQEGRSARNQIVVSPRGPRDGGDFGPFTPHTRTSGIQEALNAAKEQAKDVYLAGGSWTAGKTEPVVYHLHTTLQIPWMQNFRLDSGNCVLNYTPKTGDAVVFDSQMSCVYRWGLIVSAADGTVVRLRPSSAGPDRFKVITSCEMTFNAIVGGGGAWPGGAPYQNQLDRSRNWIGTGLWLDGSVGSIDANKITVLETVGCAVGMQLSHAVSRNTIEQVNIHLCRDHLVIGAQDDAIPNDNRIEAFLDAQGIPGARGAQVFGSRNMITLSGRDFGDQPLLAFETSAEENLAVIHSRGNVVDHSAAHSNRTLGFGQSTDAKRP